MNTGDVMGYRRIHCELQKRGLKFSGKTVRKLDATARPEVSCAPEEIPVLPGNMGLAAENILQRQFKAEAPVRNG